MEMYYILWSFKEVKICGLLNFTSSVSHLNSQDIVGVAALKRH